VTEKIKVELNIFAADKMGETVLPTDGPNAVNFRDGKPLVTEI
jgi:hypothetical protein